MSDLNGTMMSDVVPGDCPPDPLDADEPAPKHLRHEVETVELEDPPPYERCPHCSRWTRGPPPN